MDVTMRKEKETRINAFEMNLRFVTFVLRISWTGEKNK